MSVLDTVAPVSFPLNPPWGSYQPPRINGVPQNDPVTGRMTAGSGSFVPGSAADPFRPTSCMRMEVRAYTNPANLRQVVALTSATAFIPAVKDASGATVTKAVPASTSIKFRDYVPSFKADGVTSDDPVPPAMPKIVKTTTTIQDKDFLQNRERADGTDEMLRSVGVPAADGTTTVLRGLQGHTQPAPNVAVGDRFLIPSGDVNDSNANYATNRAEVVFGVPTGASNAPLSSWRYPYQSTRWFRTSFYLPAEFEFATDDKWLTLFQWKGYRGGSPPLAIEMAGNRWRFGAGFYDQFYKTKPGLSDMKTAVPGTWTEIVAGIHFDADPSLGWVEVWQDRKLEIPKTFCSTMDTDDKGVDPIYLKQGIYRTKAWTNTVTVFDGPLEVAEFSSDFGLNSAAPVAPVLSGSGGPRWGIGMAGGA